MFRNARMGRADINLVETEKNDLLIVCNIALSLIISVFNGLTTSKVVIYSLRALKLP
jgi:hypothetical protein